MTDNTNFVENLFEAIDTIVTERVKSISYDTTIKCIIKAQDPVNTSIYTVSDGTSDFIAYSENPEYKIGSAVFVLIPEGDYSKTKTILSQYIDNNTNVYMYQTPFDRFIDVTENLILYDGQTQALKKQKNFLDTGYALAANSDTTDSYYEIYLDQTEDLTGYEVLGIQADFKTYLGSKDLISGDYGILVKIVGYDKDNPNIKVTRLFKLSSMTDMYGNPYDYTTYYRQEQIFNISNFSSIESVNAYFYEGDDFTNASGNLISPDYENGNPQNEIKNIYMINPHISFGFLVDKYEPETVLLFTTSKKSSSENNNYNINSTHNYTRIYNDTIIEGNEEEPNYSSIDTLNLTNTKKIKAKWIHLFEDNTLSVIDAFDELPTLNGLKDAKIHWYLYDEAYEDVKDDIAGYGWREAYLWDSNQKAQLEKMRDTAANDKQKEYYQSVLDKYLEKILTFSVCEQKYSHFPYFENSDADNWNKSFWVYFTPNITKKVQNIKVVIEHSIAENLQVWGRENCSQAASLYKILSNEDVANGILWYNKNCIYSFANLAATSLKTKGIVWNEDKDVLLYLSKLLDEIISIFLENQIGSTINYYQSATLVLKRDDEDSVDLSTGLNIVVDKDDLKGVYNLYDTAGSIIAKSKATIKRPMYVYYKPEGSLVDEAYIASSVTWKFPSANTMIMSPVKTKEYPGEGEDIDFYTQMPEKYILTSAYTEKVEVYEEINDAVAKAIADNAALAFDYYIKDNNNYIKINKYVAGNTYYEKLNKNKIIYGGFYYKNTENKYILLDISTNQNYYYETYKNNGLYIKTTFDKCVEDKTTHITSITWKNVPINEDFYFNQYFRIKDYYLPSSKNNIIKCQVLLPSIYLKEAETTLHFQGASTNGTNYSFTFWTDKPALPVGPGVKEELKLYPVLYNYNGEPQEIKWEKLTYEWYSCNDANWLAVNNVNQGYSKRISIEVSSSIDGVNPKKITFYNGNTFNDIQSLQEIIYQYTVDNNNKRTLNEAASIIFKKVDENGNPAEFNGSGQPVLHPNLKIKATLTSQTNYRSIRFHDYNGNLVTYSINSFLNYLGKYKKESLLLKYQIDELLKDPDLNSPDESIKKSLVLKIAELWIKWKRYENVLEYIFKNDQGVENETKYSIIDYKRTLTPTTGDYYFDIDYLKNNKHPMRKESGAEFNKGIYFNRIVKYKDTNQTQREYRGWWYPGKALSVVHEKDAEYLTISSSIDENDSPTITNVEDSRFYILRAELKDQIEYAAGKTTNLVTYFPVCVMKKNDSIEHFDGCSQICYDSNGVNPRYYKESYQLYDKDYNVIDTILSVDLGLTYDENTQTLTLPTSGNEIKFNYENEGIINVTLNKDYKTDNIEETLEIIPPGYVWKIDLGSDCYKNGIGKEAYPTLTKGTNCIQPVSMYLRDNGIQVAATAYRNGDPVFTCPIVIYQDAFSMAMINAWDGSLSINEEDGTILASMLGAGKKDGYNQFEGVLMGDVGATTGDSAASVGLFGYHEGVQSFGFRTDGTAFLGKSGSGRIIFDGNKSMIQNATYGLANNFQGMKIDLDDGIIDILGPWNMNSFLDKNKKYPARSRITIKPEAPYFRINSSSGQTLFYIGNKVSLPNSSEIRKSENESYFSNLEQGYYLQSDNFSVNKINNQLSFTGTRLDLANGNLILAGNIIWSDNDTNKPYQVLYHKGQIAEASFVAEDNPVTYNSEDKNYEFKKNLNLYYIIASKNYDKNKDIYTHNSDGVVIYYRLVTSEKYNSKITYYKKSSARVYYPPKKPENKTNGIQPNTSSSGWHTTFSSDDKYYSYSTNAGETWSEPILVNGKISESSIMAALLNQNSSDGIYSNGSSIGIRASAIRTGLLYSREGKVNGTTYDDIVKNAEAACVIDLDSGRAFFGQSATFGGLLSDDAKDSKGNKINTVTSNNYIQDLMNKKIAGWTIYDKNGIYGLCHSNGKIVTHFMGDKYSATVNNTKADWTLYMNGNFGVTTEGKLYATGAKISGEITADKMYLNNLYLQSEENSTKYNKVVAKKVRIPVAFKVEAVGAYVLKNSSATGYVYPTLQECFEKAGYSIGSNDLLYRWTNGQSIYATVSIPRYIKVTTTHYNKKGEALSGTYYYKNGTTTTGIPITMENLSGVYFVAGALANTKTTIGYTYSSYQWDANAGGYNVYVTKAIEAEVYVPGGEIG